MAASRMMSLFEGSTAYCITCNPKREKSKQNVTQHRAPTLDDFNAHLSGKMGIGVSPLRNDSTCTFAALDIDRTDEKDEVDFAAIAQRVAEFHLPLVMCRTRSGGAHLYLFLKRPAPAKAVRTVINEWADKLHITGTDCKLPDCDYQQIEDDGTLHVSRSINLPYLGGDDTNRYAFAADGKTRLTLAQFLAHAESMRQEPTLLGVKIPDDPFAEAPPCVQQMAREGVPQGLRNEALAQVAIYFKKVDKNDVHARLAVFNAQHCDPPLALDELRKISKSASRRDYRYRCKTEPCKSMCNSGVCITRAYGIKQGELDEDAQREQLGNMPIITHVAKVQDTENGGVYRLTLDGGRVIEAPIKRLLSARDVQVLFLEGVRSILPAKLSYTVWYDFITPLIRDAQIDIKTEEDTEEGMLNGKLREFVGRVKEANGDDVMTNRARLETTPIMEEGKVLFTTSAFDRFLRNRHETLKIDPHKRALLLRRLGWSNKRVRTPAGLRYVWEGSLDREERSDYAGTIPAADPNNDY